VDSICGSRKPIVIGNHLSSPASDKVVRDLQYAVREGREAGEVVVIPKALIANRKNSFILHLERGAGHGE